MKEKVKEHPFSTELRDSIPHYTMIVSPSFKCIDSDMFVRYDKHGREYFVLGYDFVPCDDHHKAIFGFVGVCKGRGVVMNKHENGWFKSINKQDQVAKAISEYSNYINPQSVLESKMNKYSMAWLKH